MVLTITITAKIEEETAFLVEVQQAGIFFIAGFEGEDLRRVLGTAAPNILFPYARESIDTVCVKGGFPPVMLAPVNFDALYQQALAQASSGAKVASQPLTRLARACWIKGPRPLFIVLAVSKRSLYLLAQPGNSIQPGASHCRRPDKRYRDCSG